MFLKCRGRRKGGKIHRNWSIAGSRRYTHGQVAHGQVLYLGELNDTQREAWQRTLEVIDERTGQTRQMALLPADRRANRGLASAAWTASPCTAPPMGACWLGDHRRANAARGVGKTLRPDDARREPTDDRRPRAGACPPHRGAGISRDNRMDRHGCARNRTPMPSLDFKGKSFVYAHHLTVPFRELLVDAKKSLVGKGEKPSLDGNLIIHGDNLHALKALLPLYAGKVDCIYIDPPYNTGNEGWCYNDNVRSPLMKEWLKKSANPVEKDDLERHDKWAASRVL